MQSRIIKQIAFEWLGTFTSKVFQKFCEIINETHELYKVCFTWNCSRQDLLTVSSYADILVASYLICLVDVYAYRPVRGGDNPDTQWIIEKLYK